MNSGVRSNAQLIAVLVLTVIGAITLVGAAGMALMYGSMMAGMGC